MRSAETVTKLISLYRAESKRLEADVQASDNVGTLLAWCSCRLAIADLYEELAALRTGNVERIRPNVDRRRKPRKRIA